MTELRIEHAPRRLSRSEAFRAAALRSEERRAYVTLGVIALIVAMIAFRSLPPEFDARVRTAALLSAALLAALQCVGLLIVRRARRMDRSVSTTFSVVTVVVECLVPSAVMGSLIVCEALPPYTALSSPAVLIYFLMITLTTLRLRPALCVLAAGVCAGGYALVLGYVAIRLGISTPSTGLPLAAYVNVAFLTFVDGLAAAWVAREIRGHVEAALREVDSRREKERMELDLSAARIIQRALLPRTAPSVAGFDIAGWNRPADQTGGDYYDWQLLPDGNWIVTLADVSGHGIGPALVTAACRAYVRASSIHDGDLAALTTRINRLLADDLPSGRFVTMVSVLLRPNEQRIALLSAGHGPIVMYVGNRGTVEELQPGDLPLAIDADVSFGPADTITMSPGDVLALVTDGFVEWSRPGGADGDEQYSLERLQDSLRRHAALPAVALIDAIRADVLAFAGPTPQQDDLTIVVIKCVA